MNHLLLSLLDRLLVSIFLVVALSSCAGADVARAKMELKNMKASSYFYGVIQIDFIESVGRGELEQAERLLEQGASIHATGSEGMTALHWAMAKQNKKGFTFLLQKGANPNFIARWTDTNGYEQWESAMHMASLFEDPVYLTTLIEYGADPDLLLNKSGQTALFFSSAYRRYENVDLLLRSGANINHRSTEGMTPLGDLVGRRAYAPALYLLRSGADPTIQDRWGWSIIDSVNKFGNAGVRIGSEDDKAYSDFIEELRNRGYLG